MPVIYCKYWQDDWHNERWLTVTYSSTISFTQNIIYSITVENGALGIYGWFKELQNGIVTGR